MQSHRVNHRKPTTGEDKQNIISLAAVPRTHTRTRKHTQRMMGTHSQTLTPTHFHTVYITLQWFLHPWEFRRKERSRVTRQSDEVKKIKNMKQAAHRARIPSNDDFQQAGVLQKQSNECTQRVSI